MFYTITLFSYGGQAVFTKLKDVIVDELKNGLVYQIDCSCGKSHIGETKQYFRERIKQHKYNLRLSKIEHSSLVEHALTNFHIVKFDQAKVLMMERNINKRKMIETVRIKNRPDSMNIKEENRSVPDCYNGIPF